MSFSCKNDYMRFAHESYQMPDPAESSRPDNF